MRVTASEPVPIRVARLPWSSDWNPYQTQLYRHLRREDVALVGYASLTDGWLREHRDSVDVLHFHWHLERLIGPAGDGITARPDAELRSIEHTLMTAGELGYAIAWTVHEPARFAPGLDSVHRRVGLLLASVADVVFVHDAATRVAVRRWLDPRGDLVVTPPGHYGDAHPCGRSSAEVGRELGIDDGAPVALAFGQLRADKELSFLVRGFARVDSPEAVLVVAGQADVETAQLLRTAAARDTRIRLRLERVPDEDVRPLFGLARVQVLARSSLWTPSSLILAASLDVAVVAADLEFHRAAIGNSAFWFAPHDESSLAAAIDRAFAHPELASANVRSAAAFVRGHGWSDMAKGTADGLRGAVSAASRRADLARVALAG